MENRNFGYNSEKVMTFLIIIMRGMLNEFRCILPIKITQRVKAIATLLWREIGNFRFYLISGYVRVRCYANF